MKEEGRDDGNGVKAVETDRIADGLEVTLSRGGFGARAEPIRWHPVSDIPVECSRVNA